MFFCYRHFRPQTHFLICPLQYLFSFLIFFQHISEYCHDEVQYEDQRENKSQCSLSLKIKTSACKTTNSDCFKTNTQRKNMSFWRLSLKKQFNIVLYYCTLFWPKPSPEETEYHLSSRFARHLLNCSDHSFHISFPVQFTVTPNNSLTSFISGWWWLRLQKEIVVTLNL